MLMMMLMMLLMMMMVLMVMIVCDGEVDDDEFKRAIAASIAMKSPGHHLITTRTHWSPNTLEFRVLSNSGGPKAVDCGILALRAAVLLVPNCPRHLADTFFTGTPEQIREEMVTMFMEMDQESQFIFSQQFSNHSGRDLSITIRDALRNETLTWQTLNQYIRWRFPGMVNAVLWKQNRNDADDFFHESTDLVDPSLPLVHIVHWEPLHYEALEPINSAAADAMIFGRVLNARVYALEINDALVMLHAAPHPLKAGSTLLHFNGLSDKCYECPNDHAFITHSLRQIFPVQENVDYHYDLLTTSPIEDAVVASVDSFIYQQAVELGSGDYTLGLRMLRLQ